MGYSPYYVNVSAPLLSTTLALREVCKQLPCLGDLALLSLLLNRGRNDRQRGSLRRHRVDVSEERCADHEASGQGGVVVEAVGQRRDLRRHGQLVSPRRWNRLRSVVGAGDLSVDRSGRVRVVTEVHGKQGALAEVIGAVEGPQGPSSASTM